MNSNKSNIEHNLQPATLLRRLCALVYDSFIVFSFLILVTGLALAANQGHSLLPYRHLFLAYLFISSALFVSWFWQRAGQTLGMLAWKIKVVEHNLSPLSWRRAFIRFCLASVLTCAGGLGLLWCIFDKQKRALHDVIMQTRVVLLKR